MTQAAKMQGPQAGTTQEAQVLLQVQSKRLAMVACTRNPSNLGRLKPEDHALEVDQGYTAKHSPKK